MWANIVVDRGTILVDNETVSRLGLDEQARNFPWETSKRVYYLNAFHQLHCLVSIIILPILLNESLYLSLF
jgi:hypothetical protein